MSDFEAAAAARDDDIKEFAAAREDDAEELASAFVEAAAARLDEIDRLAAAREAVTELRLTTAASCMLVLEASTAFLDDEMKALAAAREDEAAA